MVYKCPRCNGDLTSKPDRHLNCEKCGSYSYDFVDGFWQGKTAESAEPVTHVDNKTQAAIALLQRWIDAVDGNWQISEITEDTRNFLEQLSAVR